MARPSSDPPLSALARLRLDETGELLRDLPARARAVPAGGWVAAIREALGMSVQDFAHRLGITRASAAKLEASERRGTVQLDTLQRAAAALDCDLVYALVPRRGLQQMVDTRRVEILMSIQNRTRQHMRLEAQEAPVAYTTRDLLREAERCVPDRALWKADDTEHGGT
ncbi:helix-turn-helix domain-containing protein [Stenotrophomonas sp. HITSZ_GD]|uniref:helix-turn-helix domain-containing protein n=1 Tax=Stenotrophomonas sp. HITSZ_GD TaxID=3037248 RepID=UPI00240E348F|nr:helix-turn-helix domain-containing protein [Stenotrophomonas sp. HITSZ_GD]MDG2525699.1 helix-turn-helix domain-containing protein [Stenotrophomonas sp. HITSZ_GD]